jgi:hypothetical protein
MILQTNVVACFESFGSAYHLVMYIAQQKLISKTCEAILTASFFEIRLARLVLFLYAGYWRG